MNVAHETLSSNTYSLLPPKRLELLFKDENKITFIFKNNVLDFQKMRAMAALTVMEEAQSVFMVTGAKHAI